MPHNLRAVAVLCAVAVMFAPPTATADEKGAKPGAEKPSKKPSVIPISKASNLDEVTKTLQKKLPAKTVIVPIPDEHALLVYLTEEEMKTAREVLRPFVWPPLEPEPKTFAFRFKDAKWDEVLDAYAKVSGLTMITTVKPVKGTFTFNPPAGKELTLDEILDVMNEALEPHKMVLIPRHMTFFIQSMDERTDERWGRLAALADLDRLSRHEFVSVRIPLGKVKADDVLPDAKKLLGRFGSLSVLDKSNGFLVSDTVGNLRTLVKMVRDFEAKVSDVPEPPAPKTYTFQHKNAKWDEVFDSYAKVSDLKADMKAKPTGTFTCLAPEGRKFTLGEITDLINEELAKQKLLLIRGHGSSVVVRSDEKIDPKLVSVVEWKDIGERGRTELVEVAINHGVPEPFDVTGDVGDELKKLLTPLGEVLYAKGKWVVIRDTVGNIRRILAGLESPCAEEPVPKSFTFRMKDAKWNEVLDWYAKSSGLTLITMCKPEKGTFTFDLPAGKELALTEITDVINDALLPQKWLLVRRHQTFFLHRTDEKLDTQLVPRISLDELPKRGRTELVQVVLVVRGAVLADIQEELEKLSGPLGSMFSHKGDVLLVMDTVGNVVKIKQKIDALSTEKK